MQLQAGYILDSVKIILEKTYSLDVLMGLFKQLSYFTVDIESSKKFNNHKYEDLLSVANNLISRGLPTKPSLYLENELLKAHCLNQQDPKASELESISYQINLSNDLIQKIYRALHYIDPQFHVENIPREQIKSWENLDSPFEEKFYFEELPKRASSIWLQLLEKQRELENILRFSTDSKDEVEKYFNGTINLHNEQKVDFSLEFPYQINGKRGFIVEIDGKQHELPAQKSLDNQRDEATIKAKWDKAIRIKTSEWHSIGGKVELIRKLENEDYFKILKQNCSNPLFDDHNGTIALDLTLIPFAIARIQKVLIHLLLEGKLNFEASEWNIAILERDIPCGILALVDFHDLLSSLFKLQSDSICVPKITVVVESNERFKKSKFYSSQKIDPTKNYDVFIDCSVLQRSGLTHTFRECVAQTKICIQSSYSPNTQRRFKTANLIAYKELGKTDINTTVFVENYEQVEVLKKFIQSVFRKMDFRP